MLFIPYLSSFSNNTSSDVGRESSALVVYRFQLQFSGYNHFCGNIGGGLELISAYLKTSGTIIFEENSAIVGGGIRMNDRCLVRMYSVHYISQYTNIPHYP